MVSRTYLLHRPAPPSSLRRIVHQRVIPAAIDTAGYAESLIEIIAARTRRQPRLALGLATAVGYVLAFLRPRRT